MLDIETRLKQELDVYHMRLEDIAHLDQFDASISEKVLSILLTWACYGQNITGIMLGRKYISKISRRWLASHILHVIENDFDYMDEWNFRRLLELIMDFIPERKNDVLALNEKSTNPDIIEVMNDFR